MNNHDTHPLRVALYLRVSTDDQAEKYGLDLQREAVDALVKSKGKLSDGSNAMMLAGQQYVYIDDGISGTTSLNDRPAFAKLQEDILMAPEGQKPFDVVAVYKIDRFARKLKILLDVIDFFEKHGIQFISANESIDTSTPFGKAMLGIIGVIAELEIETIKQRTQAGREEAYKKGIVMGSAAPFGYAKSAEKTYQIFEPEAVVVRLIFDKFVKERFSTQEIAYYLQENNYLSPDAMDVKYKKRSGNIHKKNDSNFWRASQIREVLQDEIYIGKYYYHKFKGTKRLLKTSWILSPTTHKSIIDKYQFETAQVLLTQSRHLIEHKLVSNKHLYLLSGLLRCDLCKTENATGEDLMNWTGSSKKLVKGHNAGNYTYSYLCVRKNRTKFSSNCDAMPLPAEPLEEYVIDLVRKLLSNPVAVYKHQLKLKSSQLEIKKERELREDIKTALNGIPAQRARLREQHTLGIIDSPTLQKEVVALEDRENKFNQKLEVIEQSIAQNFISQGYIESLDLFSQKYRNMLDDLYKNRNEIFEILHILIDKIIVSSRSTTLEDKIAGRKKDSQKIPYKLEIKLRLPKDIMSHLVSGLQVKTANL